MLDPRADSLFVPTATDCVSTVIVCGSICAFGWIAVGLRLWTKAKIVKSIGADDWWMLTSLVWIVPMGYDRSVCSLIPDLLDHLLWLCHRHIVPRWIHPQGWNPLE
jgi:hypothetical protein